MNDLKNCMCGCIYAEKVCPNCNKITDKDRIKELEAENEKLRKGLDIYQRERDRFKHAHPEMSGSYFLSGGLGDVDDNLLPQFVQIVPAYGCAWVQVYEKTDKTISYEGS